jgi:hypothetical protein
MFTLALTIGAVGGPWASAAHATVTCPPNPTPRTTVNDSVQVLPGATCTLDGVTVTGSVSVARGGVLITKDATIRGDVNVAGGNVKLEGGSVGGSVVLDDATRFRICNMAINGDLVIENRVTPAQGDVLPVCTESGEVPVSGNVVLQNNALPVNGGGPVQGNLVISRNTAAVNFAHGEVGGAAYITNNTALVRVTNTDVGGVLTCANNTPHPDLTGTTALAVNCP